MRFVGDDIGRGGRFVAQQTAVTAEINSGAWAGESDIDITARKLS
jgi:hypothetical protein